jgi:hypothetical protein
MRARSWLVLLLAPAACVGPEDSPSKVVDLRVLGVQTEPPEVMLPGCDALDPRLRDSLDPMALAPLAQPLLYRALITDPKGEGRPIRYTLYACTQQGDRDCTGERELLAEGETGPGELILPEAGNASARPLVPALLGIDPARPLPEDAFLFKVVQEDTFKGLGGIRVPLVLHVKAGEEEVFAQKLMVYSCNRFPELPGSKANENPVLPGLTLEGEEWGEGQERTLQGKGPFALAPLDFSALEEPYVVPSLALPPQPVQLKESWLISWHTDYGSISPEETGGTDVGGGEGRHDVKWAPPEGAEARERVRVWAVVRDGRGGQSWLERSFRYAP